MDESYPWGHNDIKESRARDMIGELYVWHMVFTCYFFSHESVVVHIGFDINIWVKCAWYLLKPRFATEINCMING